MIVKIKDKKIVDEIDKPDGYYNIEIKKALSEVEYTQYKYYFGYLVKPLALQSFDGDIEKAHIYLKEKYLFYPCSSEEEIPKEHFKRHIKYFYKVDNKTMMIGYLRSLTTLSNDEMNEYIFKCENFLLNEGILQLDEQGNKIREELWQANARN